MPGEVEKPRLEAVLLRTVCIPLDDNGLHIVVLLCPLALCGGKRGVPVLRRRGANI
ncbi:protein of unknown function [Caballeronia sp. S22]